MKTTVVTCDVCRDPLAEGARSFGLKLDVVLHNNNGHSRYAAHPFDFDDVCSEQCLHAALAAMVREAKMP